MREIKKSHDLIIIGGYVCERLYSLTEKIVKLHWNFEYLVPALLAQRLKRSSWLA